MFSLCPAGQIRWLSIHECIHHYMQFTCTLYEHIVTQPSFMDRDAATVTVVRMCSAASGTSDIQ